MSNTPTTAATAPRGRRTPTRPRTCKAALAAVYALAFGFVVSGSIAPAAHAQSATTAVQTTPQLQVVRGQAAELAIATDGSVYTLDGNGTPWVQRLGSGGIWSRLPGQFRALRAGLDGSIRALSQDNQLYLLAGSWWRSVNVSSGAGIVRDVAISPDGSVYTLQADGSLDAVTTSGQLIGRLDASESGGYERLIVDEHGLPWLWRSAGNALRYDGLRWVAVDRFLSVGIRRISAGLDGTLLLVDGVGKVHRWNSFSADWTPEVMPAPVYAVAIGPGGKPWYLSEQGQLWATEIFSTATAPVVRRPPAVFTRLLKWNRVNGQAQALSVGADASVITIDNSKNVWKWKGREGWSPLPGKFKRVAAATSGVVWGVDDDNRVRRFSNGQWFDTSLLAAEVAVGPKGEAWAIATNGTLARYDAGARQWRAMEGVGHTSKFIAVGREGEPWLIGTEGTVSRLTGERWTRYTGINATSVAIGPDGTVYATTAALELFWLDLRAREWKPATGVARSVSVGPGGTPWIIGERSQLFASAAFINQNEPPQQTLAKIPLASPPAVITIPPPAASVLPSLLKPFVYTLIPGRYVDVGIGADGTVYAAGTDGGLYCFDNSAKKFLFASAGSIQKIATTGYGVPWVVNAAGQVSYFDRGEWTTVPEFKASDVAIGSDAAVYAAQASNFGVYKYSPASRSFEAVTTYSTGVPLRAKKMAFAANTLWAVTPSNELLKCSDKQCQLQTIAATDVSSGPDGSILVTDMLGGVQRFNQRGGGFVSAKGNGIALSVGPQGLPWLVGIDGQILSAGLFAVGSKSVNTSTCAQKFQSKPVPSITTTATQIAATADNLALSPGGSASLLANDFFNSAPATSANVVATLTAPNPLLSVADGRIVVSANAQRGTTLSASYSICALSDPARCSVAAITIAVVSTLATNPDVVTLNPGGAFNLLANDMLNGTTPLPADITVRFAGNSALLSQADGIVTLATNAPAGSTHTGSYTLCLRNGETLCSHATSVTVTATSQVVATADAATLSPSATLNLLANDLLNGATPRSNQVTVNFSTASPHLSQTGGVLTLSAGAPTGSTQSASYSICALSNNSPCSAAVAVTITVPGAVTAIADSATLNPGATLNLLANDVVNGATPQAAQLAISFNTTSTHLSHNAGVVTLAGNAPAGSVQSASYSICLLPANAPCSGPVAVSITVPSVINAVADVATLAPGGTFNLLANDRLNGAAPAAAQLSISFTTSSASLTHNAGVVTLATNATAGSVHAASYSICEAPANARCSGPVAVTIMVASEISALADTATINPGAALNLLANDRLNGTVPQAAQVYVTFNSNSAALTQSNGVVTLAGTAAPGSNHTATYRICQRPAGTPCSALVNVSVTATPVNSILAVADVATINPGATFNLLANDLLNGVTPTAAQVTISFMTSSENISHVNGVVTLAAIAPPGTVHMGQYSICQAPANTLCSGPVTFTINATSVINAVADSATLSPGGTLNLLANDNLNGGPPDSSVVSLTFNTASPYLSQVDGLLTLAAGAPAGSTQTATYSICRIPGNTPCSGPVAITITVASTILAVADTATIPSGTTFNLLANDLLNGVMPLPAQVTITFMTSSEFISHANGVVTLAAMAPGGTTHMGQYSLCIAPANTICSGPVMFTITAASSITAVADSTTLSPGGSFDLLANDLLNGFPPNSGNVNVTFNTASPFLSQVGGLLTLAAGAPPGSMQTATYSICRIPGDTPCSGPINVTITVPSSILAVADAGSVLPGGSFNLLANDLLNGMAPLPSQVTITFMTSSEFASHLNGVVTISAMAPMGTLHTGQYSICVAPANVICSGPVNFAINVTGP